MAKNNSKLEIPEVEVEPKKALEVKPAPKKKTKNTKTGAKKKFSIARVFREMISELKKVDWAPFKKTKNSNGVFSQTATVLVVVLFFLIFISLFDAGLTKLLGLLLESASLS